MNRQLLVIDDSLTIRKLVELSFRDHGWSIEFAATGAEGAAKAATCHPDLILLDFVLPDMKATDVCQRLAGDKRSAHRPVILISAKMESVRELFKPYPMVVDFVGKPFTTPEIARSAARALAGRAAPVEAIPTTTLSLKQKEAAANAIFGRLRGELARIPDWMPLLGTQAPAPFFARRLLTADVVGGVVGALLPLCRELIGDGGGHVVKSAPAEVSAVEPSLQGRTDSWPLHDLLCALGNSNRTGELSISHGARTVIIYWHTGEMIFVTNQDPADCARDAALPLDDVPAAARARADAEQRSSGKPFYISLAEQNLLPACDVAAVVEQQGRRLLREALAARSARFVWRERASVPDYVETYGRHIELGPEPESPASTQVHTMLQLTLERLRRPSAWPESEPHLAGPQAAYDRAPGFSSKLVQLKLSANEQRVLTLIDGKTTVSSIAERAGLVTKEVARILYRLAQVELIVATGWPSSKKMRMPPVGRPVMIFEPDRDGFHEPLRQLLQSRPDPLELVDLADETDLLSAIQRERPALVILNEGASDADVADVARAIRGTPQLANVSLAAVLEAHDKTRMDDLAAAGFDAVLVKPVHYLDLSQLIASSCLAAQATTCMPQRAESHAKQTLCR
jgi:CheY-like chemotaxis protein